jgi:hypothetical protein
MSNTCEKAIVASTKYGPRSRLLRKPMMHPNAVASAAPTRSPSHGDSPHRVPRSAAE